MRPLFALSLIVCLLAAPAVRAQTPQGPEATIVEEVVVLARRSGAPMWEITRGESTVILVGEILGVPEATPWRPDALETATLRADRVISNMRVRVSASDLFRLLWRARTLTRLPGDTTSADYLDPEWQVRLEALEAAHGQDYSHDSFLIASSDLLNRRLRFKRETADDAGDVINRAARRNRIPVRSVSAGRGDELVENLLTAPPETLAPCLIAAIVATEAGPEGLVARGHAWTRFQVPAVLASPLEIALGQCWPWGDPTLGPQLKRAWLEAVDAALAQDGTTMAVAPLTVVAEPGGVLDVLEARGFDIDGPEWKAEAPATAAGGDELDSEDGA